MLISSLRFILALLLAGVTASGWAGDHIVERAYFEDASGSLTLQQIQDPAQARPWTVFKRVLAKGFTPSAIWLRLRVEPGEGVDPKQKLILRIRPAILDEIALFDPLQASDKPRITGDRWPRSADEYPSLNFNFVIPRGDAARYLWLRLKTSSTSLILVDALPVQEFQAADLRTELAYSALLALLVVFMTWGLLHWVSQRDPVVGAFVLKQLVGIGFTLASMGYLRIFMSDLMAPGAIDDFSNLMVVAYSATLFWFDYQLLREYKPPVWGVRLMQLAVLLFLPEVALIYWGQTQTALSLNVKIIFLEPMLALLLAFKSDPSLRHPGDLPPVVSKKAMVILFASFAAIFSTLALFVVGIFEPAGFLIYIVFMHGLITGVVMTVVLQLRSWRMDARRVQALADLTVVEQRAAQERQQRLEQNRFLGMLTHELKTPLSVIRLVLGSKAPAPALVAHAERAARDMNAVIERCLQAEQLADQQFTMQAQAVNLRDELQQLQRNSPSAERLHLSIPSDVPLKTDAKLLHIVLGNLLDNALKYSAAGSAVHILVTDQARHGQAGLTVCVQNIPGVAGWPDGTRVFQKYYRSPSAHHQTGSGLGLFLVHGMAQVLGGELSYASDEIFVKFKLWLPHSISSL